MNSGNNDHWSPLPYAMSDISGCNLMHFLSAILTSQKNPTSIYRSRVQSFIISDHKVVSIQIKPYTWFVSFTNVTDCKASSKSIVQWLILIDQTRHIKLVQGCPLSLHPSFKNLHVVFSLGRSWLYSSYFWPSQTGAAAMALSLVTCTSAPSSTLDREPPWLIRPTFCDYMKRHSPKVINRS